MVHTYQVVVLAAILGVAAGEPIPQGTVNECQENYRDCKWELASGGGTTFNSRKEWVSSWTEAGQKVEFKGSKKIKHSEPLSDAQSQGSHAMGLTVEDGTKAMSFDGSGISSLKLGASVASETESPPAYDGPDDACPEGKKCIKVWQQEMLRVEFNKNCYEKGGSKAFACASNSMYINAPVIGEGNAKPPKGQYMFCAIPKDGNEDLNKDESKDACKGM